MKKLFIGMERSGALRRRFQAAGWYVISVDKAPSEDNAAPRPASSWRDNPSGFHWQGDVFDVFSILHEEGAVFDLGIFHPDCTYLTWSAEWAYKDPDFKRYPGVGYHQRVKPETLVGAARRKAREKALTDVRRIRRLPIKRVAIENPEGAITRVAPFAQIVQPFQFGHDASKATGLILKGLAPLDIDPLKYVPPRLVCQECKTHYRYGEEPDGCLVCGAEAARILPRWANQTDTGQNRLSPGANRWMDRSRTYAGIADAMVEKWT